MSIIWIIVCGIVIFGGYISYTVLTHNSVSKSEADTKEDLELINKMKEVQLISATKTVQSLAEKNNLFKRSFINKFGEDALEYKSEQEEFEDGISQGVDFAARSIDSQHDNLYHVPDEITQSLDNEIQMSENEILELEKLSLITSDFNNSEFDNSSTSIIDNKTMSPVELNETYSESQLFEINNLYNTFKSFYN